MEETTNSIKDAIKERLTNPFLGKLLLAWVIWNWKIPYISFFVSEENIIPPEGIESTNKLEFVSNYLTPDSFWDFCNIYLVPFLITAILIWIVPWVSDIVFNVSEKYRLKKALKAKETDSIISNKREEIIQRLNDEIESTQKMRRKTNNENIELISLLKYFSEDYLNKEDPEYLNNEQALYLKFKDEIENNQYRHRIVRLLSDYVVSSKSTYFDELNSDNIKILVTNDIIYKSGNGIFELTNFGNSLVKNILFTKYTKFIPKLKFRYHII